MKNEATVVKARFRSRGYDDDDRDELRQEFGALGAVRLTPEWPPEAGGSYELTLVIEFIGVSFASGIIGHFASKFYDRMVAGMKRIFAHKRQKNNEEPELVISLSYDDLSVDIAVFDESYLESLPSLLKAVHRAITSGPLSEFGSTHIHVPMVKTDSGWEKVYPLYGEDDTRYWGVIAHPDCMISHVYDSWTQRILPLDDTSW